jgi:hypothetical protein
MRSQLSRALKCVVLIVTMSSVAHADVCIRIDEARDTLTQTERIAALLLIAKPFESQGQHIVPEGCTESYVLSHVRFGDTITVLLVGPSSEREAMAMSMNEVPAIYSQLVRAILSGRPVGSMTSVVDRTNVIEMQANPNRVHSDALFYVRLGYGGVLNGSGGPAMGMGVRRELDAFALDVSFLNVQIASDAGYPYGGGSSGSWLKLSALRYLNRTGNATPYVGGGMSWGSVIASHPNRHLHGSGLQGELTAGYEMLRASNIRLFIQSDVVFPFYSAKAQVFGARMTPLSERRYMPSASLSVGVGWDKGRR